MALTGAATAMGWRRNVIGPSGERLRVHGSWCSVLAREAGYGAAGVEEAGEDVVVC